jgi:purine-cytosine permease-like protein
MPILLADPVGVVLLMARAFIMIMFGGGAFMMSNLTSITESTARLIALAYTVPLALLAILGVSYWRRVDRIAAWVMLLTIGYFVVASLGGEAYSRFRVPFLPLYAMLAGGGAVALIYRRSGGITVSRSPSP